MPSSPRLRVLLLALCIPGVGCAKRAPSPATQASAAAPQPAQTPAAAERFETLVDSAFEASFAFSPSRATAAGIHTYDAKLEDRSRARIEARIGELEALLARLRAQERSALSRKCSAASSASNSPMRASMRARLRSSSFAS